LRLSQREQERGRPVDRPDCISVEDHRSVAPLS
jgi:hypothetical protein